MFQVYKTEEEWDQGEEVLDTPADTGRITVTLPGLSKGLNVWRSHDSYMIHAGTTLNEEDKIMVRQSQHALYLHKCCKQIEKSCWP